MNEPAFDDDSATLSIWLELDLERRLVIGRVRTDRGEDERVEGWLGFVDALARLQPNRKELQ
jgi:hypothetical protein